MGWSAKLAAATFAGRPGRTALDWIDRCGSNRARQWAFSLLRKNERPRWKRRPGIGRGCGRWNLGGSRRRVGALEQRPLRGHDPAVRQNKSTRLRFGFWWHQIGLG